MLSIIPLTVNNSSAFKIRGTCSFMCLIIEPSVLEMISVNISLSLEESITDDNIRKKKKMGDELPNHRCIKCVLGAF